MIKFIILLILLIITIEGKSLSKKQQINCTSPDYYYDETKTTMGAHVCFSDCECDGSRYCDESNLCTGIARELNNNVTINRTNPVSSNDIQNIYNNNSSYNSNNTNNNSSSDPSIIYKQYIYK